MASNKGENASTRGVTGFESNSERSQIDTRVAMLRTELYALLNRRNDIASVSKFPPELLSIILLLVRDSFANILHHKESLQWLPLTQVCRRWRQIAINEPRLWTHCTLGGSHEWNQLLLDRSKQALLSVIVQGAVKGKHRINIFNVLEHTHRFRDLYIETKSQAYPHLREHTTDFTTAMDMLCFISTPHLERLVLGGYSSLFLQPPRPYLFPTGFLSEGTPRLRHLRIRGWRVPWTSHLFNGLTTLNVTTGAGHDFEPISDILPGLLDALERMSGLRELVLQIRTGMSDAGDRVVRLPSLQRLDLTLCINDCVDFLHHVAFPASTIVSLDIDFWRVSEAQYEPLITLIGHGIQAAWLSNRCPTSSESLPPAGYTLLGAQTTYASIRAIRIDEGEDDFGHVTGSSQFRLVIQGWLNEAATDFAFTNFPAKAEGTSESTMPAITITFNNPPSSVIYPSLSAFPLHQLTSIFMNASPDPAVWEMISEWPSIKSLALTRKSAPQPISGLISNPNLYDAEMSMFADSIAMGEGPSAIPTSRVVDFPSVVCWYFDHVNFWSSSDNTLDPDVIDINDLFEFLSNRRDLGVPLHRIGFKKCTNLLATDVEYVQQIVPDVRWDGPFKFLRR